ncbi:phage capsid protein [Croceicoccus sp. YJ47]|uniref:phage capsid protein n=1 Tax=Croceicoccus sp. YJ47 TaxID=2798724 RepID=UPI001923187A|nr:phage capsid protein [Croceicoccus sp. YJ47]QQN75040.1 hypothetical protein JD971_04910 [Croceicoccus sp. YJ47]
MDHSAEQHRNTEYNDAVSFELAAKPGLLSPLVGSTENYAGSASARIENRFGEVDMEDSGERLGDTNLTDTPSTTRHIKVGPAADVAEMIDKNDQKVTRVPLNSPVAANIATAARRYHDRKWLEGYFGMGWEGEQGDIAVPFKSANIVDPGGTGLTKAKLLALREQMLLSDIDFEEEMPILLITPRQETNLFNIEEYNNSDFQDGHPLVRGEVKPWLGFRFVGFNPDSKRGYGEARHLTKPEGSTIRSLPAFVPSGLHRGVWTEFWGHIGPRPDKKLNIQLYGEARSAVVRTNEDKCFLLEVDEQEAA